MGNNFFLADNSRFGQVLKAEMVAHGVTGADLVFNAQMQKQRFFAV